MLLIAKFISNRVSLPGYVAFCLGMVASSHAQPPHPPGSPPKLEGRQPSQPQVQRLVSELRDVSPNSPQTVFVSVSQAEIFSGPSKDHYPTGRVKRGIAVEAFHRTPDGWLGIRPPEHSFSWVPATDAYLLPGGRVIEITNEHAVSWIGSELGSAKQYRWQVEFQVGEQLAVLGEMTNTQDDGSEVLWYKIAPPAGEFRWIHEKAVSAVPPEPIAGPASKTPAPKTPAPKTPSPKTPSSSNLKTASHAGGTTDRSVRPADFTEDVFADGTVLYADPGMETVDGEIIYDDSYYGDNYYDDGSVVIDDSDVIYESYAPSNSRSSWDGWHAMELTDDGLRIPFLERRYQQAQARRLSDPLNHDPFSLSMPSKVVQPQTIREVVSNDLEAAPTSRYTPWRNPRELREKRLQGYPNNRLGTHTDDRSAAALAYDEASRSEPSAAADGLLGRLVSAVKASDLGNGLTQGSAANGIRSGLEPPANENSPTQANANTGNSPTGNWYGFNDEAANSVAQDLNTLELAQLQLLLSEMVAQPMGAWNLQPLAFRVKYFIEHGNSSLERGQARLLLERIEDFQTLALKSGFGNSSLVSTASATGPLPANFAGASTSATTTTAGYQSANNANTTKSTTYDATGWLVPVHASTAGQPTHAISTDAGQIIAYVTGLPGMNLDIYLNQPVGIIGLRGFLPQLQAQHIQAQRVVRLR